MLTPRSLLSGARTLLLVPASLSARRADAVALTLGALSALALPPFHIVPMLFLSIPGLLRLLAQAPNGRAAARRGWWFGFGLYLLGLYWITEAILVEAARYWWLVPLAVPALAAFMAIFVTLPAMVTRRARPGWSALLTLAGAWVLADLARQFALSGFPWNLWGSVWAIPGAAGDLMLQPAALVGAHGLSLATLLLAGMAALGRRALKPAGLLLLLWCGFGFWRLQQPLPAPAGPHVIIAQANIAQGLKWDRGRALAIFRRYLELTAEGVARAAPAAAVIVWPETASPFPLEQDAAARAAIAQAAGGLPVLAGSVRWDAARRPRNSLIPVLPDGRMGEIYDKWHLVPFGEVQPWWFPLPIQVVPGGGFAPGAGPRTIRLPGLPPFGPLICYEAIFGGEIIDRANRPAWLVNVTNDAWFGHSTGPYQHLAAARLRAVEEGLPVIRAANTGISAVYDGIGRELGRLALGESGVMNTPLPAATVPPLFARWGLILPFLLAGAALLTGFFASRRPPDSDNRQILR